MWRMDVTFYNALDEAGSYTNGFFVWPDDANQGVDAPGTSPGLIIGPGTRSGAVGRATDDSDWYNLPVNAGQLLTVTLTVDCYNGFSATLRLWRAAGTLINIDDAPACGSATLACNATLLAGANVKIMVDRDTAAGGYTLAVSVLSDPDGSAAATADNAVPSPAPPLWHLCN